MPVSPGQDMISAGKYLGLAVLVFAVDAGFTLANLPFEIVFIVAGASGLLLGYAALLFVRGVDKYRDNFWRG